MVPAASTGPKAFIPNARYFPRKYLQESYRFESFRKTNIFASHVFTN